MALGEVVSDVYSKSEGEKIEIFKDLQLIDKNLENSNTCLANLNNVLCEIIN